jgi:hypothetical protein
MHNGEKYKVIGGDRSAMANEMKIMAVIINEIMDNGENEK